MKPLKDHEEVEEVDPEETLEEEEPVEEDQADSTTVMSKAIWLDTVLIRDDHGSLTAEPMGRQSNNSHN
jgi:hypothetical protein